jgi:hypothetical protein
VSNGAHATQISFTFVLHMHVCQRRKSAEWDNISTYRMP